ncbi:MAG TPA: cell division protein FtsZ, partial [Candidatus Dojkabacteria bacterium]|nr:cell division protein FtsZ [Candidatus Dojkabacteria bacterium]
FIDAMKMVDSVLAEGVNSISMLISQTGYINADFNDAKSVMQNAGTALMGIGRASGEKRAELAARAATTSPLLDMSIEGATGVLYNIVGADLTLPEISLVSELIKEAVDPSANIKFGAQIDPSLGDEIVITIVATGFDEKKQVYTKKQKGEEDEVDIFGLEGVTDEIKSFEEEKTPEENVQKEEESYIDTIPQPDEFEDPLDKPAFMRKIFKKKE